MSSPADHKAVAGGYPDPHPGYPAGAAQPYPYPYPPPYPQPYPYGPPPMGGAQPYPYPYVAGAPPVPPPYDYRPSRRSFSLFRCLLSFIVASFIALCLVTLVLYVALRPYLPEVTVSSATVSGFYLSVATQHMSANFDLTFTLHNPSDKTDIDYDEVGAAVLYGPEVIAYAPMPSFSQANRTTTDVRARLVALEHGLSDDAVSGMEWDRTHGDGAVKFRLKLFAWVRFKKESWSGRHPMMVYCEDVPIGFNNAPLATGSLLSTSPKECMVTV